MLRCASSLCPPVEIIMANPHEDHVWELPCENIVNLIGKVPGVSDIINKSTTSAAAYAGRNRRVIEAGDRAEVTEPLKNTSFVRAKTHKPACPRSSTHPNEGSERGTYVEPRAQTVPNQTDCPFLLRPRAHWFDGPE